MPISASFEVDKVKKYVLYWIPIIVSHFRDMLGEQDMFWVKRTVASRTPCMKCLVSEDDILLCKKAMNEN